MAHVHEVVIRWGPTILDVVHVDPAGSYAFDGIELVREGEVVASRARVGLVDVTVSPTALPPRSLPYAHTDDKRVVPYLGIALVLHLVMWGVAVTKYPQRDGWVDGTPRNQPRPFHVTRIAPAMVSRIEVPAETASDVSMHLDEPTASDGDDDSDEPRGGGNALDPGVMNAAIYPSNSDGGALASLTRGADVSSGFDSSQLYGGLGEYSGGFGYARSGFVPNNGGAKGSGGWGTIGKGRYGTIGHGSGIGWGYGAGGRGLGPTARRYRGVSMKICGRDSEQLCHVLGDFDKKVVHRYLRRRVAPLVNCYEKELLVGQPKQNVVLVSYTIDRIGRVQHVTASGVSSDVAACVAKAVESIEYPADDSGLTRVQVSLMFENPS